MDELLARLEVIERLLKIALSKREYAALIEDEKQSVFQDYGSDLNRYFPSDPEYRAAELPFRLFNQAADDILHNIKFLPVEE